MSRRARARAGTDKRAISYFTGDAPDIEAAFARLNAERKREPDDNPMQLKDGATVDTKAWWTLPATSPTNSEGAV